MTGQNQFVSQPAFDFGDEPYDDPTNPTFSVGELADAINDQLRRGFSDGVWVRGEIDGLRQGGPHTYFALVEHTDTGKAVMNVSLFAPMKRNLTPLLKKNRLELADGMKVRIFGALDFYAPNGRLGIKMAGIDPRFTLGELSQVRDQVVRRLVSSGLFDANRRRSLSPVALNVGVVASVGTAAWHDFHNEIETSHLGFRLVVCDTRVQGEGAERSVAASISTLTRRSDLDCVVVIRGGGARNELATFDSEHIALAIARSPIPVLTGLGHEIDRSVADEVAHTALKTPTACAGSLIENVSAYRDSTERQWRSITMLASSTLERKGMSLSGRAHRIARRTHAAVERADERLATRVGRLRASPERQLVLSRRKLTDIEDRVGRRVPQLFDTEDHRLDAIASRVALLDPVNVLKRGWSMTRDSNGRIVRSISDVAPGAQVTTQLADGILTSRIEES